MEKFDSAAEGKVWQRVAARPGPIRDDLRPLTESAREAVGDCYFLMTTLKGPAGEAAKKLHESAQDTLACLRGLQLLRGSPPRKQPPLPPRSRDPRRVLEQCYHRCRRMAVEYTARSADQECGAVFQHLAQREQENCVRIAWLLGMGT